MPSVVALPAGFFLAILFNVLKSHFDTTTITKHPTLTRRRVQFAFRRWPFFFGKLLTQPRSVHEVDQTWPK